MGSISSPKIPLPALPPRYEIRKLTSKHEPWTSALQYHANIFHSPHKYTPLYHGRKTHAALHAVRTSPRGFGYAIQTGQCWGVFDTEYVYLRPASAATDGALYWDEYWSQLGTDKRLPGDDEDETLGERLLLDGMDFPLVSFTISHDDTVSPPLSLLREFAEASPEVVHLYAVMNEVRKAQEREAVERGEFEDTNGRVGFRLKRAGTATRRDYEGKGIMKALSLWVLDWAEKEGYQRVFGRSSNKAVGHVWLDLPSRIEGKHWSSKLIGHVNVHDYEMEVDDGNGGKKKVKPFEVSGKEDSMSIEVYLNPTPKKQKLEPSNDQT